MDEQTVYTAESPIQTPENRQDAVRYAPVSTGAFFGYKILYGIPVIGWILCIVFSFTQKNVNKRNFARATLIGMIISLVLTCLLAVAVVKVAEVVIEQVAMEALGGSLEELGPVKDVLDELKDGKYDEMISRVEDGEFGDHPELSGMLEELKDGGVLGVVNQIQNGGFEDVAAKFEQGAYDDLIEKALDGEFGDLGALGQMLEGLADGDLSDIPVE